MDATEIKALAAELLPALTDAFKPLIASVAPAPIVPVADIALDAIDTWVEHLLGAGAPPPAPTPETAAARLGQLEQHVAALTIASRQAGTANLTTNKVAAAASAKLINATSTHET